MAPYAEQVILCTGKEDWASNIEQEEGATGEFVSGLKGVIGKGGEGFDVCTPSCITQLPGLPANIHSHSTIFS
jgi:leucyl-tRNA synthetase